MTWWKKSGKNFGDTHQNFATEYGDRWVKFLDDDPNDEAIMKFALEMAEEYKGNYWKNKYYFKLYQKVPRGSWSKYR